MWWFRFDSNEGAPGYEPGATRHRATEPLVWYPVMGSSHRPPACRTGALPSELTGHGWRRGARTHTSRIKSPLLCHSSSAPSDGGDAGGNRTRGFLFDRQALWPLSYSVDELAPPEGFEPPALAFVARRSGPLSYGGDVRCFRGAGYQPAPEALPRLTSCDGKAIGLAGRIRTSGLLLPKQARLPGCATARWRKAGRVERLGRRRRFSKPRPGLPGLPSLLWWRRWEFNPRTCRLQGGALSRLSYVPWGLQGAAPPCVRAVGELRGTRTRLARLKAW